MVKKGVLRITGNTSPKTGVKTFYKVTEWYPDTPLSERKESLVTWELFRKRENGKFTTTTIKKQGINHFTFGKDAWKYTFRVEGYLHDSEGKEPMSIIVQPQKNDQKAAPKEKDILGVKLTFQDGTPVNKKLSYKDRLWATAKCQGMEGEHIMFTLWEDDETGDGHNKKNQAIVKSPPVLVDSQGYARWNFALLNTYIAIANKREDDKKQHEYYVTAEYKGKLKTSDNASVDNPEYKAPTPPPKKPTGSNNSEKPQSKPKPAPPKPKPDSPKGSTRPNSPNNQPDKKGEITQIKLTDINGKDFTKNPKFGETIKVSIKSKNLIGKKCTLKIWEHDLIRDDLLYSNDHTFSSDNLDVLIPLTDKMQKTGEIGNDPKNPDSGEYWKGGQQEIFAEVIILNISSKSKIIDVDIMEAPKKQDDGITATKNEKKPPATNKVCECEEFKLIWGKKVSCKFRKKVVAIAKDLWPDDYKNMANNLMAVFAWETGETFKTDIPNRKGSGATGLIQFLPERAQEYLGKCTMESVPNYFNSKDPKLHNLPRVKEFAEMKPEDQLDYVKKYFEDIRGKKLEFVDFYLKVLFPASMLKPEHYVFGLEKFKNEIGLASDSEKVRQKRVDKYSTNSGMDTFKDGKISKSEIALSIQPFITKGIPEIFSKGKNTSPNNTDPTSKSDSVVITDAGHGIGGDPGAGSGPDTESVLTLEVETKTAESLATLGIKNTRTRTTVLPSQKVDQVTFRANIFKNNNGKVMVSHHLNSVGDTFLIMYHPPKLNKFINPKKPKEGYKSVAGGSSPEFLKNSLTLGKYIKEELIKIGRKAELREATVPHTNYSSLGILRNVDGSDNAGVLIEMGSVSDTNTKYLRDHSQEIGNAIANGIAKYLDVKPGEKKENNFEECEEADPIKPISNTSSPAKTDQCPNGKCIHFADVVPNPVLNTQGVKNKNRFHGVPRTRTKKIGGKTVTYTYYHGATDILTKVGTPVHSLTCGEVVHIRTDLPQNDSKKGYESPSSYGNTIMIKSNIEGFGTVYFFYAHLSQVSVKVGQKVKHNDPIGFSGSTGNAMHVDVSVRHVHIEAGTQITSVKELKCIIVKEKRIDPEQFMKTKFDKNGNAIN
ncbi:MAG: peptidoglycan DD-metalloendopeptidase family protein [Chryseobacterium jejuense]|uniref:peptidoglycan DD-metalloendopeptidase family protein n=1 Tax=Chryseobacterium jejuense TaxID=445960 RepID=UPI003D0EB437